jgi:hypothetical protein
MSKIETAAHREEKVRDLSRKIGKHCASYYERLTDKQRTVLMEKLDELDRALNDFREYDRPWDSQLIKVAHNIGGVRVHGLALSTFESVMDHAREVFTFLVLPDDV